MALGRKKTLNVFNDAKDAKGSYDDYPVGPKGIDPMPHLSRNRMRQPFFLVSSADQVLIQMAGSGSIEFKEFEPSSMTLEPGDTVYLPAGIPSRLTPRGENVQVRLKAEPPVREAVAWYCEGCGELIHSEEIPAGIFHGAYWSAVQRFNESEDARRCSLCGELHGPVDLGDIAWPEVARALGE